MQRLLLKTRQISKTASFSTTTTAASSSTPFSSLHEQYRKDILNSSLEHVHQYGWTEDSIAHGIVSNTKKYPPSFIGMMNDNHSKSSDLIHFFMKECNLKLKSHLDGRKMQTQMQSQGDDGKVNMNANANTNTTDHGELLKYGIQHRLEMVIPFVRSNTWSQGMAVGATPYNAMSTASHLEEIVDILEDSLLADANTNSTSRRNLNPLERTAIGAVYVTTELHLLADTSPGYHDTWKFLNYSIDELDMIQQQQTMPQLNQETLVAGVAVASSLGGAVLSLMTPFARNGVGAMAGTIVPQVMNFMSYASSSTGNGASSASSSTPGTMAKDYDVSDLPPFDVKGQK
jgi:rpsU-divergently transcribed protein